MIHRPTRCSALCALIAGTLLLVIAAPVSAGEVPAASSSEPAAAERQVGVLPLVADRKVSRRQKQQLDELEQALWQAWSAARPADRRLEGKRRFQSRRDRRLKSAAAAGRRAEVGFVVDAALRRAGRRGLVVELWLIEVESSKLVREAEVKIDGDTAPSAFTDAVGVLAAALPQPPEPAPAPEPAPTPAPDVATAAPPASGAPGAAGDGAPGEAAAPVGETGVAPASGGSLQGPLLGAGAFLGGAALVSVAAGTVLGVTAANGRAFEESASLDAGARRDVNAQILTLSIGADAFFVTAAVTGLASAGLLGAGLLMGGEE